MTTDSVQSLVEHRRQTGAGRLDECWDGVWHLTDPSATHQRLAGQIYRIHAEAVEDAGRGSVWISINVTDRAVGWLDNHRCPDGAVILAGNRGHWIGERQAAYLGGPDLVVEILSPGDETPQKLPFYAALGVREVLIIDPETRRPQLLRLVSGAFHAVWNTLRSEVTGLEYAATGAGLEIRQPATGRTWTL
jgi:Uma2 family endonuclease